jgi:IS5 family transposase
VLPRPAGKRRHGAARQHGDRGSDAHGPSDSTLLSDAVRVIEAAISCFKRAYGATRCTWHGLDHFKAYIWSAVVAHNLVLFARLKPT